MDFKSLTAHLNSAGQRVERGVDWHPLLQSECGALLAHARRSRMSRYLEALAGIGDPVPLTFRIEKSWVR